MMGKIDEMLEKIDPEDAALVRAAQQDFALAAASKRLRAVNDKLLAALQCQDVMNLRDGPIVAIHAVRDRILKKHGWDGREDRRDFVDQLTADALTEARSLTPPVPPAPPQT